MTASLRKLLFVLFTSAISVYGVLYSGAHASFPLPQEPEILLADHLLVHTLKGEIILVHRTTGFVNWSRQLDPSLQATYNRGPILIVDPIEARLYEYSADPSDDLFIHLDHSVIGYVRRSPTYYRNFITFGSKNDFWISLDLRTGALIQAANQNSVDQCPGQANPIINVNSESSEPYSSVFSTNAVLGLGRTQYNLLFRDPATGTPRLNITYNTFASHAELELQSSTIQHVATNQPSLLTFRGREILWSLPLSSPVVGLYTVQKPSIHTVSEKCRTLVHTPTHISETITRHSVINDSEPHDKLTEDQKPGNEQHEPEGSGQTLHNTLVVECNSSQSEASPLAAPHTLRQIAFTTYVLDVPSSFLGHHDLLRSYLQAKFNGTLDLALSLVVDKSNSAPLYAIPCVAESSIPLRGIHRTPDQFLLEGPEKATDFPANPYLNWDNWSQGVVGLYELPPTQLSRWSSLNEVPFWARLPRLRQITDGNIGWSVILSGPSVFVDRGENQLLLVAGSETSRSGYFGSVLVVLGCALSLCFTLWLLKQQQRSIDPNFLPPTFDLPNLDGWAGCSAEEVGQPEDIRFNLKHVLGHGANGTMVFAGTFGQHETAVKRIVRQPHLEKHWRREHTILLHHHHPNLVRCFWTGSTANFHYLVMQRCAASLTDLLRVESENGFDKWGLVPVRVINEIVLGVACLHKNRIVHRDLKPSNILIATSNGEARVVVGDFGLSRPLTMHRQELTNSFGLNLLLGCTGTVAKHGSSVTYSDTAVSRKILDDLVSSDQTSADVAFGTLGWMAPELCNPNLGPLTYAVDIFSCGLLAYHVLTYGGHPFDHGSVSEQQTISINGDSSANGSSGLLHPSDRSLNNSGSTDNNGFSAAAHINRHHFRQLAIAENRTPSLERLTESGLDISKGFLSRNLIQMMLFHDPNRRPIAEEVIAHPLFWSANKIMHFISELSDILDTREDLLWEAKSVGAGGTSIEGNHGSNHSHTPDDRFISQRICLLDDIEASSPWVFNEHWFYRLEADLVRDLLRTRGYQDTSLMDLLRAIRNKRNHIWHLQEHIRDLLGHTQEGMASYWTSRFPSLLPLLYGLSRCHLTGYNALSEYLPPLGVGQIPTTADVLCDWWRTNTPGKDSTGVNRDAFEGEKSESFALVSEQLVQRRQLIARPWKRGEVLLPSQEKATLQLSENPAGMIPASDQECAISSPNEKPTCEEPDALVGVTKSHSRRRPKHSKKIRPLKKKRDQTHQLLTAGCELPLHVA